MASLCIAGIVGHSSYCATQSPRRRRHFFFSLRSFNLCPDCFHLKKKNVCNVGLFSFVICISVCWGVSVDGGSFAFFFF